MARFIDAVRFWAETTGNKYKIPRKGTAEYVEVMGFLDELKKIEAGDAKPKKASKMSAPMGGAGASYPAPAPMSAPKMSKADKALAREEAKFQEGRLRAIAKDDAEAAAPKKKRKIRIVEEEIVEKPMRFPKARRAVARAVPSPAPKEMKTIEQSAIVAEERSDEDRVMPEKHVSDTSTPLMTEEQWKRNFKVLTALLLDRKVKKADKQLYTALSAYFPTRLSYTSDEDAFKERAVPFLKALANIFNDYKKGTMAHFKKMPVELEWNDWYYNGSDGLEYIRRTNFRERYSFGHGSDRKKNAATGLSIFFNIYTEKTGTDGAFAWSEGSSSVARKGYFFGFGNNASAGDKFINRIAERVADDD